MSICNRLLYRYKNGNYFISIYSDGTKIRKTFEDEFNPLFPESIDLKITNYCDQNCPMCHEMASLSGVHADLNWKFLHSLNRGTELAIGGGNPLAHPKLIEFLTLMKIKGVICNMTINSFHLIKDKEFVQSLIDKKLIYGLGVSVLYERDCDEVISFVRKNPNTVIHLIAGILDNRIINRLSDKDLKILILGYKTFGKGISYYSDEVEKKINYIKDNLLEISKHFLVVSFDNLAISQLDIKNQISESDFNKYFMGEDGMFTMYIDLVKEEFSVSSITKERYKIKDNIIDMFKIVRKKNI